jgi:hypothetical protein
MRLVICVLFCWASGNAAGARLFPIHDGEFCGFADASGKVAVAPKFQDCGAFSEGLAPVQAEGLWGYVDETGALVIGPRFLSADAFSEGLAFVTVSGESKAVIDRRGKVLFPANYYQHGKFSEGLAAVRPVTHWICPGAGFEVHESCSDGKGVAHDYLFGYIDTSGAMAIAPRVFGAGEFREGLAYADRGFIDRRGNQVISGPFSSASSFASGAAAVQVDHRTWGYIDKRGGWLALPAYDEAGPIQDSRGLVRREGKYGYVDPSGTLVIAADFDSALPFSEGRAAVRRNGKWGYIDPSGKAVIPFQFEAAQSFLDGAAVVVMDSRTAVIDARGQILRTQPTGLAEIFRRLQGFEVEPDGVGPIGEILPILAVYKEQLRQLTIEVLKGVDDPAKAKAAIETQLRKAGIRSPVDKPKDNETRPYGLISDLEIVQPTLQPTLLSVAFHLDVANAVDTSLSLFRREGNNWNLVFKSDLGDHSKEDSDIYHVAPPQFTASDSKGSFLMLLASDSGRYGNGSYILWIDVFRVDAGFNKQQLFHTGYASKDHQVALDANGFRLETISMEHDAARAGYRVFPYRYEIHGDQVTRVAPIGFDAHDFVGEWGNLSWEEASRWADPSNLARIQQYHTKLRSPEGYFGGEFGELQVCDSQQRFWQIEFGPGEDRATWFLIERKDKWTFIVKDIGPKMQEGCSAVKEEPGRPFQTMFSKPLEW